MDHTLDVECEWQGAGRRLEDPQTDTPSHPHLTGGPTSIILVFGMYILHLLHPDYLCTLVLAVNSSPRLNKQFIGEHYTIKLKFELPETPNVEHLGSRLSVHSPTDIPKSHPCIQRGQCLAFG